MKAVVFDEFGPPDVLEVTEMPEPEPGPGEVMVRVGAVSVGRTLDIAARAGALPFANIELPHIPGAEHAGVVAALGTGVGGLQEGERVAVSPVLTCGECRYCRCGHEDACPNLRLIGVHGPGAYAEYTVVPASNVQRIEDDLSDVEASALALSGPAAQQQLREAGVEKESWVLVQAAGSALGSLTTALAVHRGARVVATSRQQWKREALAALGIEAALDWTEPDFPERVRELTGGAGIDVAIDNIGSAPMWDSTVPTLARRGTVVTSGAFVGDTVCVDLRALYTNGHRILGVRTGDRASVEELWRAVSAGFRPVVDRSFPLEAASEAHSYVEADQNFGRVALIVNGADG